MNPTEEQIAERLPVWEALSEFFLDTELQPEDHERIAEVLAASPYSIDQIKNILMGEVCPVCRANALSPAGEWLGFDTQWLKEKASRHYGTTPKLKRLFEFGQGWMYARHWNKIEPRISELRLKNIFHLWPSVFICG